MKQQVYPRRIVFNHAYVLKHDAQRTYIYSREKITSEGRVGINQSWMTKIHPVYAMLLALLSEPLVWEEAVKEWAYFLDINSEEAAAILQPFLDRDEPFYSKYDGVVSQFPKNVIIDADKSFVPMESYQVEEFAYTKNQHGAGASHLCPTNGCFHAGQCLYHILYLLLCRPLYSSPADGFLACPIHY